MEKLFIQTTVGTIFIYLFLIVMLRLVGRRTLSQLSALDLLIVVLLGSSVETAMVHASTSLKVGLLSAALLVVANGLLSWGMKKSKRFRHLVNGGPLLLVHSGHLVTAHMRKAGLTESDIREALREREFACVDDVQFAVLESDGRINVVRRWASVNVETQE